MKLTTVITAPRERVFHFHDDPKNLIRITPPNIHITIDRFDPPGEGAIVDVTLRRARFIKVKWRLRLSKYDPSNVFEDTMISGPFAEWVHVREFSGNGPVTTLTETIRYTLPFGILGKLAGAAFIGAMIRRVFTYRQQRLKELLEQPA